LPACDGNSVTAELKFDGTAYNRTPAALALDNIGSTADGNDTLLIINRIGGNLGAGSFNAWHTVRFVLRRRRKRGELFHRRKLPTQKLYHQQLPAHDSQVRDFRPGRQNRLAENLQPEIEAFIPLESCKSCLKAFCFDLVSSRGGAMSWQKWAASKFYGNRPVRNRRSGGVAAGSREVPAA